ncbi:MAG: hypothetical protein K9H65_00955 [Bacteroidales bacterium]|nr:hypothetical protein [Bacteroidales bacterium]
MKSILVTMVFLIIGANLCAQEASLIRKNQGIFNISFGFNSQHMKEADVWYFYHNNEEIISWQRKPTPINMKAVSINVAFHFNLFSL